MKSQFDIYDSQLDITDKMSLESQVKVLYEVANNVLDQGAVKARVTKYKLQKYIKSEDINKRIYALDKIVSDGKGKAETVPSDEEIHIILKDINKWLSEAVARRYVQREIESQVEQALIDRQDKYVDEIRLGIIRKQKGPENAKTLKKYASLEVLESKKLSKNIQSLLRPESFEEIVGQERAIKALISS